MPRIHLKNGSVLRPQRGRSAAEPPETGPRDACWRVFLRCKNRDSKGIDSGDTLCPINGSNKQLTRNYTDEYGLTYQ